MDYIDYFFGIERFNWDDFSQSKDQCLINYALQLKKKRDIKKYGKLNPNYFQIHLNPNKQEKKS